MGAVVVGSSSRKAIGAKIHSHQAMVELLKWCFEGTVPITFLVGAPWHLSLPGTPATFQSIRDVCGGLMEVDHNTLSHSELSVARIRLKDSNMVGTPHVIRLPDRGVFYWLIMEVLSDANDVGNSGDAIIHGTPFAGHLSPSPFHSSIGSLPTEDETNSSTLPASLQSLGGRFWEHDRDVSANLEVVTINTHSPVSLVVALGGFTLQYQCTSEVGASTSLVEDDQGVELVCVEGISDRGEEPFVPLGQGPPVSCSATYSTQTLVVVSSPSLPEVVALAIGHLPEAKHSATTTNQACQGEVAVARVQSFTPSCVESPGSDLVPIKPDCFAEARMGSGFKSQGCLGVQGTISDILGVPRALLKNRSSLLSGPRDLSHHPLRGGLGELEGGVDNGNPKETSAWVLSKMADFGAFVGLSYEGHESEVLGLFCSLEPQRSSSIANTTTGVTELSNKRIEKELRRLSSSIQSPHPSNPLRSVAQKARGVFVDHKICFLHVFLNKNSSLIMHRTLKPYPISAHRIVPAHIDQPDWAIDGIPKIEPNSELQNIVEIKTPELIERMRETCRYCNSSSGEDEGLKPLEKTRWKEVLEWFKRRIKIARVVLDAAARVIRPGVTTDEIDEVVHKATIDAGGYPSPLNYNYFPKSCCTSVNEVICHGIPDGRRLEDGDIVNVDVTVYYKGVHGDLNETYFVGKVDEASQQLVQCTYECLEKAISIGAFTTSADPPPPASASICTPQSTAIKPGVRFREVGEVINRHASMMGFSVVKSICGHGIGELFHCAPNIPHYGRNKAVGVMKVGQTFTIEPMINAGVWHDRMWPDGWTAVTADGKRSAQFEHTLLVTATGVEVLTARLPSSPNMYPWLNV
ncbi:hypothetical protein HHK36_028712 [Tetracentron sinense]|uniref:Peptidase M24 domain-containing protein n=1 Tax=Tetracentron sinense TaxID=13715 RepID=A0A834YDM0_TETSI|nr:hypothetical protein HHK36_028712 [Tetracentron sinense]